MGMALSLVIADSRHSGRVVAKPSNTVRPITRRPKLAAPQTQNGAYFQQKSALFPRTVLTSPTIAAVSSHP
jgi:hypothetical protein